MPALQYLDFDFSDEDSGRGSFDAMASVRPERLPALLREIEQVLQWAFAHFESRAEDHDMHGETSTDAVDSAEWDHALQCSIEPDSTASTIGFDRHTGRIVMALNEESATHASRPAEARVTISLTLSGTHAFCEALRARFDIEDHPS